jgi:hypothetical protein
MANKCNVKRIELSIRQGRKLMLKYRNEQKQEVAEEFDLPVIIQFSQCHELWMPLLLIRKNFLFRSDQQGALSVSGTL